MEKIKEKLMGSSHSSSGNTLEKSNNDYNDSSSGSKLQHPISNSEGGTYGSNTGSNTHGGSNIMPGSFDNDDSYNSHNTTSHTSSTPNKPFDPYSKSGQQTAAGDRTGYGSNQTHGQEYGTTGTTGSTTGYGSNQGRDYGTGSHDSSLSRSRDGGILNQHTDQPYDTTHHSSNNPLSSSNHSSNNPLSSSNHSSNNPLSSSHTDQRYDNAHSSNNPLSGSHHQSGDQRYDTNQRSGDQRYDTHHLNNDAPGSNSHHYGRDAAVAGGVGAGGVGAYELGKNQPSSQPLTQTSSYGQHNQPGGAHDPSLTDRSRDTNTSGSHTGGGILGSSSDRHRDDNTSGSKTGGGIINKLTGRDRDNNESESRTGGGILGSSSSGSHNTRDRGLGSSEHRSESPGLTEARKMGERAYEAGWRDAIEHVKREQSQHGSSQYGSSQHGSGRAF